MDIKSDINSQDFTSKVKQPNNNINEENTTSDIHSINKIFSIYFTKYCLCGIILL